MKKPKKLFVIKKYIYAKDVTEAIRIDKTRKPDDIWIDEEWKKMNTEHEFKSNNPVGFKDKKK